MATAYAQAQMSGCARSVDACRLPSTVLQLFTWCCAGMVLRCTFLHYNTCMPEHTRPEYRLIACALTPANRLRCYQGAGRRELQEGVQGD